MTSTPAKHYRVLAIHPASRSFGYALFESPETLIDWGVRSTRSDKAEQTIEKVTDLFIHYAPDVLVLEDDTDSRRGSRIKELLTSLRALAVLHDVKPRSVSKRHIRAVFSKYNAGTREQIASALASRYTELAPWLPCHRTAYTSDDYKMAAFDAASLAFTYLSNAGNPTLRSRQIQHWASKTEVAQAVIARYPELRAYLVHERKWKERFHANMFDAVALAMTAG